MAANGWCPSGRFFEAAACGTPLFSDWFAGLEDFFIDGEELRIVRSTADVIAAMQLTTPNSATWRERARERTLEQHAGLRRAQELLGYLEQLRGATAPLISDGPDTHIPLRGNAGHPQPSR